MYVQAHESIGVRDVNDHYFSTQDKIWLVHIKYTYVYVTVSVHAYKSTLRERTYAYRISFYFYYLDYI